MYYFISVILLSCKKLQCLQYKNAESKLCKPQSFQKMAVVWHLKESNIVSTIKHTFFSYAKKNTTLVAHGHKYSKHGKCTNTGVILIERAFWGAISNKMTGFHSLGFTEELRCPLTSGMSTGSTLPPTSSPVGLSVQEVGTYYS